MITQRFFVKLLPLCMILFLAVNLAGASPPTPDYWPTGGWRTSTPEAQGLDSERLASLLEYIQRRDFDIHSLTIIRNGYMVLDAYRYPQAADVPHIIHSCTKSVSSTLIGIAIEQGYLEGVDQPLLDIFSNRIASSGRAVANLDADKEAITLEDVLTMSSGLNCRDSYLYRWEGMAQMRATDDWVQFMLDLPMRDVPGERFEYCNGGSYLLSAIISETTGMSALDFAQAHLFDPLGITDVTWATNPQGNNLGWGEMRLTAHDMAKFGYLFLHEGHWDGEQIVSADWVRAATRQHIEAGTLADGYGYQWWIMDAGFYMALGYAGQYIAVLPDQNMVVVFTSALPEREFFTPRDLLRYYILPAMESDSSLPENPGGVARLEEAVASFASPDPRPVPALPEMAGTVNGRDYVLEENDMEWEAFNLRFITGADDPPPEVAMVMNMERTHLDLVVGLDNAYRFAETRLGTIGLRGFWLDDDTLVLHMQQPGYAYRMDITITFDQDGRGAAIILATSTGGFRQDVRATLHR